MKRMILVLLAACMLLAAASTGLADSTKDVLNGMSNLFNSMSNLTQALSQTEETPKPEGTEKLSGPTVDVKVEGKTLKVHEEFKEMLDEYEEFFDTYIEVMSDKNANLIQYMSVLTQYAEMMEALESIDEETLSDDDAKYYVVVLNRINTKLIVVDP